MIHSISSFLNRFFLRNPSKPLFWLILGLLFKGALFLGVVLNHPYHDIPGIWGAAQGDDSSYIAPIDNLLQYGSYSPDFRMPGYGFPYLFFRLFFAQAGACNALIVLQIILASASVYFLALTAKSIFNKDSVFYLTFYLYLICGFSNFFDAYIGSESLCTSFIIFSVYFFTCYFRQQENKYLLYSGALATWSMFIRPAFGGLFPLYGFLILFQKGTVFQPKIKPAFILFIPFFIFEGTWIFRNYETHKKLIPFSSTGSPFYPGASDTYLQPIFEFGQSWGGVCTYTNRPLDIDWFQYTYPHMPPISHYDSLPDNIYTSAFNKDSLLMLKRMILALQNPSISLATASDYQYQLRTKFENYRLSLEREKPFMYFVKAPLKMIVVMLYGPETRIYLERGKCVPVLGKFIILFNNLIYLFTILTGLAGIAGSIIYGIKQRSYLLIIPFIPLYTILVHPFLFRLHFNRYLMPAYPFLIVCASWMMVKVYEKYRVFKNGNTS